jgi:hypothetical protein
MKNAWLKARPQIAQRSTPPAKKARRAARVLTCAKYKPRKPFLEVRGALATCWAPFAAPAFRRLADRFFGLPG